jgi:hypothetical protein
MPELAGIGPNDEHLPGGKAQSQPFPEASEPVSGGRHVVWLAEDSSPLRLLHSVSRRPGMSVAFWHSTASKPFHKPPALGLPFGRENIKRAQVV